MKGHFVKFEAAIFLALLALSAHANGSACSGTTHGIPLSSKIAKVDIRVPSTLFKELGAPQIETIENGVKFSAWYDILHTKSGTANVYSRQDCGILLVAMESSAGTSALMKSLQAPEIDLILDGKLTEVLSPKLK